MTRQKLAEMMCHLNCVGNHAMSCIFTAYIIVRTFPMTSGHLYVNWELKLQPERRWYGYGGRESTGCLHPSSLMFHLLRSLSSSARCLTRVEMPKTHGKHPASVKTHR